MHEKTFNTAGPCDPERHYMLPPEARLGPVARLIDEAGYFVVHAPRQCGKTTSFQALAARLTREGTYTALWMSCEMAQGWHFGKPASGEDITAWLLAEQERRAKEEGADVALIDTAGRLQNKSELMAELAKIVRVMRKIDEDAPHETLLVLDATVGQNALSQVESFRSVTDITGLVMTKLDGTAKGGVLVAVAQRHAIPIHFIGVGEKAEDLQQFDAASFSRALVGLE